MKSKSILIVDDDEGYRKVAALVLEDDYHIEAVSNAGEALEILEKTAFDLVLMDIMMPKMTGLEALKIIKSRWPGIEVMMITVVEDKDNIVNSIKLGAYDYIIKGCSHEELRKRVGNAFENITNLEKLRGLQLGSDVKVFEDMLIGPSKSSKKLLKELNLAASCNATCMLTGETGTGKDVAARFIHQNSERADQPFLIINLPAIPENLLESSLFGHEKGAFTGAVQTLAGKFELADSGTIFLDEIGEMSLEHQSKLLRVIETGEFERVGSSRRRYCNVRIITATSRDLEELVAAGKFRQDLLFRIKVMPIHVAPLRDRTADIRPLTAHFLNILNRRNSKKILGVTDEVIFVFEKQQWKGNIRELAHLLERMVIYCDPQKNILDESDIPFEYMLSDSKNGEPDGLVAKKEAFERQLLMRALVRNGFNKSATARELGMPVETLRYRVEKFGINVTRLGEG